MHNSFRNKTAIVGIGISEVSRSADSVAGSLAVDAIQAAVNDAGLRLNDIDGMVTYAGGFEYGHSASLDGIDRVSVDYAVEQLGIKSLNWFAEVKGGGPALSPLSAAVNAVYSGQCKYAVFFRSFYRPKGRRFGVRAENTASGIEQFLLPYGYGNMLQFAASRLTKFMHEFGLKKEQLGEYVLHCHRQAMLNPNAAVQQEITMDEYLDSPYYVEPISRLDADVPVDAALAFIVTTDDRSKDLKQKPVYVSAINNRLGSDPYYGFYAPPEFDEMPNHYVAKDIWERAGFGKDELGFVQYYDGFSYDPFIWAAHLGLCKPEDMGDYIVEAVRKGKEADVPITTMGGCLCEGRLHGMGHLYEAVLQLQGRADQRQLNDVQTGVIAVGGFNSTGVIALRS